MERDALAIDGGPRASGEFEGVGEPKVGHEEFLQLADTWGYSSSAIERIRRIIEDEDIGDGPYLARYKDGSKTQRMEAELQELLGVSHVLALSSGTAALHTAYVAADVGVGDEVILPAYTFMATGMAVVVAHAVPVWCGGRVDDDGPR